MARQQAKAKDGFEVIGLKAINPVNGQEIPVWVADYVLVDYGTGSIMAVPGADDRDLGFAKENGLEIIYPMNNQEFANYSEIKQNPTAYKIQVPSGQKLSLPLADKTSDQAKKILTDWLIGNNKAS